MRRKFGFPDIEQTGLGTTKETRKRRPHTKRQNTTISPNAVASYIVATSRAPKDKQHTVEIKRQLKTLKAQATETEHSRPYTCKYAKVCLAHSFTDITQTGNIPKEFKRSRIIAILKPGKPAIDSPKSYRAIALLSATYKLLERLIYNRIGARILAVISVEQAGFRAKRSCANQVLKLTTHIEAGFQRKLKT